jgi:uncharacterized protein Yka (UPF0111/DUF47 family)
MLRRWFLPETPDMRGLLRTQLEATRDGVDGFVAWTAGDAEAAGRVRDAEHRGDAAKREVLNSLRGAFVTTLEPEDIFSLSRGIDWILNYTRDLLNEAEAMDARADAGLAEMASLLQDGVEEIGAAVDALESDGDRAIAAADAAIRRGREVEHAYFRGMAALLEVREMHERIALRELYRRCSRIGETVIDVSERVVYAVVKRS